MRGSLEVPEIEALVCFSHLRWSFVWQRPQHLLSRMANIFRVVVVEEPEFGHSRAPFVKREQRGDVTVLTPCMAASDDVQPGFNDANNERIAKLLEPEFEALGLLNRATTVAVWYYTPMARGAEPRLFIPDLTIYDVMDELANFRGAPAQLKHKEQSLLERADLVFTGGPSLFRARAGPHPDVHCFPSGVDASHFATALDRTDTPADISDLSGPVIGFYGVLDERLDTALIDGIAALRPTWQLVLIGPVVKITGEDLPHRDNIHYLGMREYSELPSYLAGFDAAILPFARNEATKFISPTKTLEYMAAAKPIVSTSIRDVVELYGRVVTIADDPADFVAAVESAWAMSAVERQVRHAEMRDLLREHDWDVIAARMTGLMRDKLSDRVFRQSYVYSTPITRYEIAAAGGSD